MNQRIDKEYWEYVWDKFRSGDRGAFETLYYEFVDTLFSYGTRFTKDKGMVEDAIQDVFVDAYSYGRKLRQPEYIGYYLHKSLKNNLVRKIADNRHAVYDDDQMVFELRFPVEEMDERKVQEEEWVTRLQEEIRILDSGKRELLFLKFNNGLTYTEIGNLLDIQPETVKKQVQRLLKYFREKLGDNF